MQMKQKQINKISKNLALSGMLILTSCISIAKPLQMLLPSESLPKEYFQKDSIKPAQKHSQIPAPKRFLQCASCHGTNGTSSAPGARGNIAIAGLPRYKIIGDLRAYKSKVGNKGGTQTIMQEQAKDLSEKDIQALADYISKLPRRK